MKKKDGNHITINSDIFSELGMIWLNYKSEMNEEISLQETTKRLLHSNKLNLNPVEKNIVLTEIFCYESCLKINNPQLFWDFLSQLDIDDFDEIPQEILKYLTLEFNDKDNNFVFSNWGSQIRFFANNTNANMKKAVELISPEYPITSIFDKEGAIKNFRKDLSYCAHKISFLLDLTNFKELIFDSLFNYLREEIKKLKKDDSK